MTFSELLIIGLDPAASASWWYEPPTPLPLSGQPVREGLAGRLLC
jgi:hypothetical protein